MHHCGTSCSPRKTTPANRFATRQQFHLTPSANSWRAAQGRTARARNPAPAGQNGSLGASGIEDGCRQEPFRLASQPLIKAVACAADSPEGSLGSNPEMLTVSK
jgi:hypothetical protein